MKKVILSSVLLSSMAFSQTLSIKSGWAMYGFDSSVNIENTFKNINEINSIWRYNNQTKNWQLYSPSIDTSSIINSASSIESSIKNIEKNEGVWINSSKDLEVEIILNRVKKINSINALSKTITWDKLYKDEITQGFTNSSSKAISYSKWHNKLTLIDTKKESENILSNDYHLNVSGERYTIDSVSGASEQVLKKVLLSSDDKKVFSLLQMYNDSSKDSVVGVYSSSLDNTNNTKMQTSNSSSFYNGVFDDIYLSKDNKTLLVSNDEDDEVYVFDSNNLTSPNSTITLEKSPRAIALIDDIVILGLYKRKNSSLALYKKSGEYLGEYSFENYPNNILIGNNNNIFVSNSNEKIIYELDISKPSNISLKNKFNTSNYIKSYKLSTDSNFLYVALQGDKLDILNTKNLGNKISKDLDGGVFEVYESAENEISVVFANKIEKYSLNIEEVE